ncbi:MAG: translocation/assembly module TamB domain-containing protein [Legionella sp.]|nr:translocation/assembly module TamB domain-containing protein [Legionella sp.]
MSRFLIKSLYIVSLLMLLLAGVAVFLVATTPGLHTLINIGRLYLPGSIKIQQIKGSLLNDFTLEQIEYQNKNTHIKAAELNVQWQPDTSLKTHFLTAQWRNLQGQLSKEQKFQSNLGTLKATATLPNVTVHLNSNLSAAANENWQLKANAQGVLPWQWTVDASLTQAPNTSSKQAGLHANLSLRGIIKDSQHGTMVFTIHPGYYQTPESLSIPALQFKGGTINTALSPPGLTSKGTLAVDPNKNLKLTLNLPQFSLDSGLKDAQRMNGELVLEINSLDFLQGFTPEISKLQGQLVASLKVQGTVAKPQITSQIILSKTSATLPKLGLDFNAIDLNVIGKEKRWEATGALTSAGHNLTLKGTGTLVSDFIGDVTLEGADFPLMKTSEFQINVSPQLKLHFTPKTHLLTGSVLVPNAQIKLQTFTNSQTLPDEVVFKKQQEQPSSSSAFSSNMDITITMGEQVEINVKGLKGHLDGTLNLKQQPQGPINAYGELSVSDGTYKAYGQDLAIKQGQLIFTGGAITNPGINLRAAKKINNTPAAYTSATQLFDFNTSNIQGANLGDTIVLGVEVTGRLTKPKIQLFSEPSILSQADILSMLVLGRPASQANKAGGQLLLAAISSMNVGGTNSTQLLEQLKQTSGLDFNVQTNTNYNQATNTVTDSTAFVVGKSLSKRLYLSYNIGLSQTDANMLTLKYILNKFFSIQISTTDTSSAIDFLYTSNKKRSTKKK